MQGITLTGKLSMHNINLPLRHSLSTYPAHVPIKLGTNECCRKNAGYFYLITMQSAVVNAFIVI